MIFFLNLFDELKVMIKKIFYLPFAPLLLLLLPLVAMQFTDQVRWSLFDFVIMGILLLITGFWTKKVIDRVKSFPKRVIFISLVILLFLLIWAELAVGIFGSPFAGS
mgnify:FL=1